MNLAFDLFTLFSNEDAIVLVGLVLLLHIVQQGVLHVVFVEEGILGVFL